MLLILVISAWNPEQRAINFPWALRNPKSLATPTLKMPAVVDTSSTVGAAAVVPVEPNIKLTEIDQKDPEIEPNEESQRSNSVTTIDSVKDLSQISSSVHSLSLRIPMSERIRQTGLTDKTFPELLEAYRQSAKESKDDRFRYNFAQYLLSSARKIMDCPEKLGIHFESEDTRPVEERQREMAQILEKEAVKWLKKMANRSRLPFEEAQFQMAEIYGQGLYGCRVDHARAFQYYFSASKQNHPPSCYRVAACYEMGAGVKKDEARAIQFYRKAAALGDPLSMHKYALMLLYGHLGMKRNLREGVSWLKRAAAVATAEHPQSLMDLARLFEKDSGCPMVIPDEGYALELYRKAANLRHAPAQYRLGTCLEFGLLGCKEDPVTALKWYAKAADQGLPDAELALSHWYLTGTPATALGDPDAEQNYILKPNEEEAFNWARKAAERGHPKAQYTLGYYFEEGIGCEADFGQALLWYRRSAEQKYHRALQRLTELKLPYKKSSGKCVIQ